MKTRQQRMAQLAHLFHEQKSKCHVCGKPAVLDHAGHPMSAVRFRTGSSYGEPGRRRPRVMAHKKCAQERSDQITQSQLIDDLRHRAGRHQTEFYEIPDAAAPESPQEIGDAHD
jgi:hypothetical protein